MQDGIAVKRARSQSVTIGLAMFSMFFGAGNIIFPLAVGQFAQEKIFFAILGLILTAAIIPIIGVIAMMLFQGDYKLFFGRMGKSFGFTLALVTISLLGPLGSTPRCIALAYSTLKDSFLFLSPIMFSAVACALVFICALKKKHFLNLLGWVFTPILLTSLITIILIGFLAEHEPLSNERTPLQAFFFGLKEGYNTMDLLAAFFFSSTILAILREQTLEPKNRAKVMLRGSIVAALLLAAIYSGFSYLAAFHSNPLEGAKEELLATITLKLAGPWAGTLVCIIIVLACLTTAIALISAFTDFMQKEVFKERASYSQILIGALLLTFITSTFQFTGISAFLGPILQICYPGLILLTLLNIAYRLKNFAPIKWPVFCAFALSTLFYLIDTF